MTTWKSILLCVVADQDAKCVITNVKGYRGYWGCSYCEIQGTIEFFCCCFCSLFGMDV